MGTSSGGKGGGSVVVILVAALMTWSEVFLRRVVAVCSALCFSWLVGFLESA